MVLSEKRYRLVAEDRMTRAERRRAEMYGDRVVRRAHGYELKPAYGVTRLGELEDAALPHEQAVAEKFYRDAGLNANQMRMFEKQRKIVRMQTAVGDSMVVVPNIPGLTADALSNYTASEPDEYFDDLPIVSEEKRRYQLSAFFSDTSVSDKFQLSSRRLQSIKRLAVTDPAAAAVALTGVISARGYPNYSVFAGDYARSTARFKEIIHQHASTVTYSDIGATAVVYPDKISLTYDLHGEALWTVYAPLKYAVEAQCIYQLAIHHTPQGVMCMLAVETATLRIDIYDEVEKAYCTGVLNGYSSLDGIFPSAVVYPSGMTADKKSRLAMASAKLDPIISDVGNVVGTAVRVSDRHVVLNTHTITMASEANVGLMLQGTSIGAVKTVADDLSVVERKGNGVQWPLRDAVLGEDVVLCYHVGSQVEFSEVLRVRAVTDAILTLSYSNMLRPGASGAAVVALRDFALLGMFVTKSDYAVRCSVFSPEAFLQVIEADSVASPSVRMDEGGEGYMTYDHMVRHGLRSYLESLDDAIVPIPSLDGKQQGIAVAYNDMLVTSVDPASGSQQSSIALADGPWQSTAVGSLWFKTLVGGSPQLLNTRKPSADEDVCVCTRLQGDFVMSQIARVQGLTHVDSGHMKFVVTGIDDSKETLLHGLVISTTDGACLGHVNAELRDLFGAPVYQCVSLMERGVVTPVMTNGFMDLVHDSAVLDIMDSVKPAKDHMALSLMGRSLITVVGMERAVRGEMATHDSEQSESVYEETLSSLWYEAAGRAPEAVNGYWKVRYEAIIGQCFMSNPELAKKLCMRLHQDTVSTPIASGFPRK